MLFTDPNELKRLLDIDLDDRSQDWQLMLYGREATKLIEEWLNRDFSLKSRTVFYSGSGSQKLLLKHRPVRATPTPRVWVDNAAFYGTTDGAFADNTELTYGEDFCLALDEDMNDDGTPDASKSGIMIRIGDYWPVPIVRQAGMLSPFIGNGFGNIKVVTTAGYTADQVPSGILMGCRLLVARMMYLFPLGMEIHGENYEDRSISISTSQKNYLWGLVKNHIWQHRNWKW